VNKFFEERLLIKENELEILKKEKQEILSSTRYRVGAMLVEATTSIKGFLKLPINSYRFLKSHYVNKKREALAIKTKPIVKGTSSDVIKMDSIRNAMIETNRNYGRGPFEEGRPLVSIIVTKHNENKSLCVLFESFRETVFYENYEIVVCVNVSDHEEIAFLSTQQEQFAQKIQIVQSGENQPFSQTGNQAFLKTSGRFVMFLGGNMEVTDYWLDALLWHAFHHNDAGIIGAKLVYPEVPAGSIHCEKSYLVLHAGFVFEPCEFEGMPFFRPVNRCEGRKVFMDDVDNKQEVAAVSAAAMLIKREVFQELNGFDEAYEYGYEDVDICLRALEKGQKVYYASSSLLFYHENKMKKSVHDADIQKWKSTRVFQNRWQAFLEKKIPYDKLSGELVFSENPLTVAFVVTSANQITAAGDFFTAVEFAEALADLGCGVEYIEQNSPDWYQVSKHVDVLIAMLYTYDISKIKKVNPVLITVAWMRNWFDKWCENPSIHQYDLLFATSNPACDYVYQQLGRKAELFPIATNPKRFLQEMEKPSPEIEKRRFCSDYAFTGSYWNHAREIIQILDQTGMGYKLKIFGANWDAFPHLACSAAGFIPYRDIPKVYKYTKIVVDDANHVTKPYGSVNSRVFDALGAGRLVLTNGTIGAEDTFRNLLPSFSNQEEFLQLLSDYLKNPKKRERKVKELQSFVLENHTYDIRASKFLDIIKALFAGPEKKIAIMVPAPKWKTVHEWGDYHFALALQRQFENRRYAVEIRLLPEWRRRFYGKHVLVLRGLSVYFPQKAHTNILWNISHPDDVTIEEYNQYDYVLVASKQLETALVSKLSIPIEAMMQCTDPDIFYPDPKEEKKTQILFVGNSRNVFRKILRDLLPTSYDLSVYGTRWEDFLEPQYIKGQYIPNGELCSFYSSCEILLNDHWDDMKETGIISNRIFDGLAAGAFIVTDEVIGLCGVFDGCVAIYKDKKDLQKKIDFYMTRPEVRKEMIEKGRQLVLSDHTVSQRAKRILELFQSIGK